MTLGGWITFLISTVSFTVLFIFFLYKVLTTKHLPENHLPDLDN